MKRPLAAVLLALAIPVHAETIVPIPEVHKPAWNATDIVIVSEGEVTDGNVEVLETWKGTLARGARIAVPALAAYAGETRVSGERILLFLTADGGEWTPASIAWIANGTVFVSEYQKISGRVIKASGTEREWKRGIEETLAVQRALQKAMAEADPAKIEAAVPALFQSQSFFVAETVIMALGDAGPKAVPALRRVLADESLGWYFGEAIRALVKAAGHTAPAQLAEVLADDLLFWQHTAPALEGEWWSDPEMPEVEQFRLLTRYTRLEAALAALTALRQPGTNVADKVVARICELWQSSPQLRGGERGDVDAACDAAPEYRP